MIEACISSMTGACRRENEDRGYADASVGLLGVFDGMFANGAAAQIALEHLSALPADSISAGGAALRQLAYTIDAQIRTTIEARGKGPFATTFLVAAIREHRVTLAHVGDGRAYLFRDGTLSQLSRDHTLAEELTASGALSREEALRSPNGSVITRALGFGASCEPDLIEVVPQNGDVLLLCTRGVWAALAEAELIGAILGGPFSDCASRITEIAASPGQDNSTVAAVRFSGGM
jgi:protein phosphatase